MAIKKLIAENAVIKTVSVEVKALTISGKQVTLAVFRQLQEKPLIDLENLQLNGIPWGWVNYHLDKCAEFADYHIHVVWQAGSELYRSTVDSGVYNSRAREKLDATERVCAAIAYLEDDGEGWTAEPHDKMSKKIHVTAGDNTWSLVLRVPGVQMYYPDGRSVPHVEAQKIVDSAQSLKGLTAQEAFGRILLPALREHDHWKARYADLYAQLSELDQLFIAV